MISSSSGWGELLRRHKSVPDGPMCIFRLEGLDLLRSAVKIWSADATLDRFYRLIDDPCESAEMDRDVQQKVRAQQVKVISRMTPVVMTGKICVAIAFGLILFQSDQLTPLAAIWSMFAVIVSVHVLMGWLNRRTRPVPQSVPRESSNKVVQSSILFALIWSVPGAILMPQLTDSAHSFATVMAAGMVAGGAISLYALPAAAILYCSIVTASTLTGVAISESDPFVSYFIVALAFLFVSTKSILRHSEILVSEFIGRLELDQKNEEIKQLLNQVETAAIAERRKSELRLAHAKKMEAIGQLTGGIAHDFNNLLAAIQGNTELLDLEGNADPSLTKPILDSTQRGSELVHRLLSFASKQMLKPRRLNAADLTDKILSLLQRAVRADTKVTSDISADLWDIHADPSQLETSVINLVLNANEALPKGGDVKITCRNVLAENSLALQDLGIRAGAFVCIQVQDDGRGMSARTKERAIDPFFTTKNIGDGSGLGLSTVYGFVRQSGGHLCIESELGTGTTVTLFLPRLIDSERYSKPSQQTEVMPLGQRERILIVEDDPAVRQMVGDMLVSLNFRITFAKDYASALEVVGPSDGLDLVLTDVVLPGDFNGPELAARLKQIRPDLPILFMSGFTTRNCLSGQFEPEHLLVKPFNRKDLAEFICNGLICSNT